MFADVARITELPEHHEMSYVCCVDCVVWQQAAKENAKQREIEEKMKRAKEAQEKREREKEEKLARKKVLVDMNNGERRC